MELLGHMEILFLIIWGTSILFSSVAIQIYIPTHSAQGFPCFHILPSMCYLLSFWCYPFWQVWGDIVVLKISDVDHVLVYLLTIYLLWKKSVFMSFAHFSIGLFIFLLLSCMSFYIFWIVTSSLIYGLQIYFYILKIVFLFCWSFLLLCRSFLVSCSPTCFLFLFLFFI